MNRSILIVICDFLLLSLLTFSTDINRMADDQTSRSARVDIVTNEVVNPGKDLAEVMKLALAEERTNHGQMLQQLAETRSTANQQQAQLSQQKMQLTQRAQENARLQEQFTAAQTNVETLTRQLRITAAQSQLSDEKLAAAEADARKQAELAATLQTKLAALSQTNLLAQNEEQRLATQLQVVEAERRAAADRATLMQQQAQIDRTEKTQFAEAFKALATNSGALAREIRENRSLAPNSIFSEFITNRVTASFVASRSGFLHIALTKNVTASTVLATDGTNIFALCHVKDTPLTFGDPGTEWDELIGTLIGRGEPIPIRAISFHQADPRVVMMPTSAAEAQQLGCRVYRISSDPYKFQDAVIVGADTGYYGECNFQIQLDAPQYVKLDRSFLRGLVGKFNPARGDVVFSRTGELLGIMVNGTYCLIIHDFATAATLTCGPDVCAEHTGSILSMLYDDIFQLPMRLQ